MAVVLLFAVTAGAFLAPGLKGVDGLYPAPLEGVNDDAALPNPAPEPLPFGEDFEAATTAAAASSGAGLDVGDFFGDVKDEEDPECDCA